MNEEDRSVYELTPNQQTIDYLLGMQPVRDEYIDTAIAAVHHRAGGDSAEMFKVPRFRYVLQYRAGIYDFNNASFIEGDWNDRHEMVAQSAGVTSRDHSNELDYKYMSYDVFVLRGAPNIRVAIVHGYINARDLELFQQSGYTVMARNNFDYLWAFFDEQELNGVGFCPSALSN